MQRNCKHFIYRMFRKHNGLWSWMSRCNICCIHQRKVSCTAITWIPHSSPLLPRPHVSPGFKWNLPLVLWFVTLPCCSLPSSTSSLAALCLCLYANLPPSPLPFSPHLYFHSVTLDRLHDLKFPLKSQTSSFSSSSISLSLTILLPSPPFISSAHIFLNIHIYILNFSYIFCPSPLLSLSTSLVPVFHAWIIHVSLILLAILPCSLMSL